MSDVIDISPDDLAGLLPPEQIAHMLRVCRLAISADSALVDAVKANPGRARAALLEMARAQLVPGVHCILVRYQDKRSGTYLGYQLTRRGIVSTAARLGYSLHPVVVREGEEVVIDAGQIVRHIQQPFSGRRIIGAYCTSHGPDGPGPTGFADRPKMMASAHASRADTMTGPHEVDRWIKVAMVQTLKLLPDAPAEILDAMAARAADRPALPRASRAPLALPPAVPAPAETPAALQLTATPADEADDLGF